MATAQGVKCAQHVYVWAWRPPLITILLSLHDLCLDPCADLSVFASIAITVAGNALFIIGFVWFCQVVGLASRILIVLIILVCSIALARILVRGKADAK